MLKRCLPSNVSVAAGTNLARNSATYAFAFLCSLMSIRRSPLTSDEYFLLIALLQPSPRDPRRLSSLHTDLPAPRARAPAPGGRALRAVARGCRPRSAA